MAKGNLFLGQGRGKVGDVVFFRADGEQITRARNRQPRNPRTALQLAQRVFLKTSSSAYALLQALCNHSFQGYAEGSHCQSRFNRLNIDAMRTRLHDELNSGDPQSILTSTTSNFAAKNSSGAEMNSYIVSEGSITSVQVQKNTTADSGFALVCDTLPSQATYQDVVNALGLQQGDQLTFLELCIDDTRESGVFNGFKYSRIILEPSDGDMSSEFLGTGGRPNKPNVKNEGSVRLDFGTSGIDFHHAAFSKEEGMMNSVAAAAVIVSRKSMTGQWLRSSQSLVLRSTLQSVTDHLEFEHRVDYLGDAVASFMTDTGSTLYLNQSDFQ